MLRNLRWQLSGIYVLAAAVLVILISGGVYGLVNYYFESSMDLALQYKVALEYTKLGQSVPTDLQDANRAWQNNRMPATTSSQPKSEGESDSEQNTPLDSSESGEEWYDSQLASIFILPIDSQGQIISNPNTYTLSFSPDSQAVEAALVNGSDFRTVQTDSIRIRLFTYRVSIEDGVSVLQVGRSLKDQDRLLHQLLVGLIIMGSICILVVGLSSWWLAGRSLIPAQQAWNRQQTFIANASHELRTPLTLMRASAEVARRSLNTQDEGYALLGDILTETDHMSHLVEDLLLLSRLDVGSLKLELQPVVADTILNDLSREMSRVATERSVTLDVLDTEGTVLADPTRLRQVLLILLDNALHHTSAGGSIHLSARVAGSQVKWQISDTGSGISAKHLPHVFERFYRGETDRSQEGGGSGLGLAIAKGLVEAMQGQITIVSQTGQGTQVLLTLPASDA